ncbi:cobalamin-independent methionine synthase catalytic subunit [Streptomyces sp. Amel2xB2]|uniref:methionine synthase n=1 Tax=Streptomyces sp. Amel2xB2 TaxID=1305829 RepID=UPI000DB924CB|nr:methionine synthase [Streptomyces sp. Amel2xB2]RAJ63382.1 cobalamin-independent methionine synthase catalytic subunit [Streptomyces sp. Amel2xB2]
MSTENAPAGAARTASGAVWGAAAATGVGSMPGEDPREAARTVTGTLETFPFLPELPARGPGADMTGRTVGLLVELYAHLEPSGWRIGDRPGRDTRRARSWLSEDLDALEEFTQEDHGGRRALKLSAVGPWTLAAGLERRNGEAVLGDAGACRDVTASLVEGLRNHLVDVRRRVPGTPLVLQLDEPMLTAVLLGRVPTASGYRTHGAVDRAVAEGALREITGACAAEDVPVVVHSCAPRPPFALLRRAGAAGVSFDARLLTEGEYDAVGEAVEGGTVLFAGVVPGDGPPSGGLSDPAGSVGGVRSLWRRLGLSPALLTESVVVTPACGMAGASPAYARAALAHCVRAARSLADDPE